MKIVKIPLQNMKSQQGLGWVPASSSAATPPHATSSFLRGDNGRDQILWRVHQTCTSLHQQWPSTAKVPHPGGKGLKSGSGVTGEITFQVNQVVPPPSPQRIQKESQHRRAVQRGRRTSLSASQLTTPRHSGTFHDTSGHHRDLRKHFWDHLKHF